MCMPAGLMSGIGLVTNIVGTVSGMNSQAQARKQAQQQAAYTQSVNERNAQVAENNARDATEQGLKDQEAARRKYKAQVGEMATQYGAGNVLLSSGSALDMLSDTADLGELEALDIGAQAQRKSQEYLRNASDLRNQGTIAVNQAAANTPSAFEQVANVASGVNNIVTSGNNFMNSFSKNTHKNLDNDSKDNLTFGDLENNTKKRGASYF